MVAPGRNLGIARWKNSYVLEDWLQRLCIQDAFGGSVESLRAWLGTTVSVRTAEHMSREMSQYVDDFRGEAVPPAEEEEELLVITADGKGVPMRRTLAARLRAESEAGVGRKGRKCRRRGNGRNHGCRGRGAFFASGRAFGGAREKQREAPGKKQMAYVGSVYTQARFPRTAEDVIDEVRRRKRARERPEPQHKHVWAEMTRFKEGEVLAAAPMLFFEILMECCRRDPANKKPCICVMDGERQLWKLAAEWFPEAIWILDLFHALKRLWEVAHCLYAEGSDSRSDRAWSNGH